MLLRLGAVSDHGPAAGAEKEPAEKVEAGNSSRMSDLWALGGHFLLHHCECGRIYDAWPGVLYPDGRLAAVDGRMPLPSTPHQRSCIGFVGKHLIDGGPPPALSVGGPAAFLSGKRMSSTRKRVLKGILRCSRTTLV